MKRQLLRVFGVMAMVSSMSLAQPVHVNASAKPMDRPVEEVPDTTKDFIEGQAARNFAHEAVFGWSDLSSMADLRLFDDLLDRGFVGGLNSLGEFFWLDAGVVLEIPPTPEMVAASVRASVWLGTISGDYGSVAASGAWFKNSEQNLLVVLVVPKDQDKAKSTVDFIMSFLYRNWCRCCGCEHCDDQYKSDMDALDIEMNTCWETLRNKYFARIMGCGGGMLLSCIGCSIPIAQIISCPLCGVAIGCLAHAPVGMWSDTSNIETMYNGQAECYCLKARARATGVEPPDCQVFQCP